MLIQYVSDQNKGRPFIKKVFPVTFSELDKCCIITDNLPDKMFLAETIIKEVNK